MKTFYQLLSLCLFIAILLAAGSASAQTTQIKFLPVDDSFTRGGASAGIVHGTTAADSGLIRVRMPVSGLADNARHLYLKFNLTTVRGKVDSAKLSLTLERAVGDANPSRDRADFYKLADDSWTEETLTWNNAPPIGALLFRTIIKRKTSTDPLVTYTWDVTKYVQEEMAGNKIVSFVARDDSSVGSDTRFFSKENPNAFPPEKPTLTLFVNTTAVKDRGLTNPTDFALKQNYPNPFNPETRIAFELAKTAPVEIGVYDIAGKRVAILLNETKSPGAHHVTWNGHTDLGLQAPSGVYFARAKAEGHTKTIKMILMR